MDIRCTNCGEPYEFLYLMDDVKRRPHSEDARGFAFHPPTSANVVECPACPRDGEGRVVRRAPTEQDEMRAVLAELLGDDLDGFASECDAFGL